MALILGVLIRGVVILGVLILKGVESLVPISLGSASSGSERQLEASEIGALGGNGTGLPLDARGGSTAPRSRPRSVRPAALSSSESDDPEEDSRAGTSSESLESGSRSDTNPAKPGRYGCECSLCLVVPG